MAEALARRKWPKCQIKSVGVNVTKIGAPAATQAVQVMKRFGMDIKDHKTTPIADVNISSFEYIICLSKRVRNIVAGFPNVAESRIRELFVRDPFQNNVGQYERCANAIAKGLNSIRF